MPTGDKVNLQGGKERGRKFSSLDAQLDEVNARYVEDDVFKDVEDLPDKLLAYKAKFIDFDEDMSGDLDILDLKRMMEKLGQAKTHLELKKMLAEVDKTNSGTITYPEFLDMMLGSKNSVLRLILKFEEKMKPLESPKGVAPQRSLADLP